MSVLKKLEDKVLTISSNMDYKHVVNMSEEGIGNESYARDLDIPIVGGLLYIFHSFKQAKVFMRNHDKKLNVRKQAVNIIKEEEKIYRSIRRQLDSFLDSMEVSVIEVPDKHMTKFKKVVGEYSDSITWSSRPDGKVVLVKKNGL